MMSALGQKQTFQSVRPMSALPPTADIGTQPRNVRFVPKADIASLDQLVSAREQRWWHYEAERLGGPYIDRQIETCRRLEW